MKAITLHQPWATLIAVGVKTIETRSWPTKHRGPIAIHAAKRFDKAGWEESLPATDLPGLSPDAWVMLASRRQPFGAVVATANLVDCIPMVDAVPICEFPDAADRVLQITDDVHGRRICVLDRWPGGGEIADPSRRSDLPYGDFAPGRWAWLLEDIEPLYEPVPARGRQGLWNWEPS